MTKITLEIDSETLEKANNLAEKRHISLSQLLTEMIHVLSSSNVVDDPILGMVADEPELADAILQEIEHRRNRLKG